MVSDSISHPLVAAAVPVESDDGQQLSDGIGIALSGGGYRAMLFHLGTLWRLRDAGLLQQAQRISSDSGGSITSGALALAWDRTNWADNGALRRAQPCQRRGAAHQCLRVGRSAPMKGPSISLRRSIAANWTARCEHLASRFALCAGGSSKID